LNKDTLGKEGEKIAKKYFLAKNYLLIKENYRFERAETDLIFEDRDNKTIIFVEVKARRSKTFGEPEESITSKKIEHLVKSAEGFIYEHPEFEDYERRIDVFTIFKKGKKEIINHIENAI
jgi:putative endonuclease